MVDEGINIYFGDVCFMASVSAKLVLGNKITVQVMAGRADQVISRLPNGLVVLFDQNSPYFDLLAPGQSVECHIIYIRENYVIVSPISEPVEMEIVHLPQVQTDDIIEDLEKLIEKVEGNAEVIPRALLRIIQLQQLMIKILTGEVQ